MRNLRNTYKFIITVLISLAMGTVGLTGCSSSDSINSAANSSLISTDNFTEVGGFTGGYAKTSNNMNSISNTDSSYSDDSNYYEDSTSENVSDTEIADAETYESKDFSTTLYEDKLIYRCNIDVETKSYDECYQALQSLITKYNCILASENYSDNKSSYDYYRYTNGQYIKSRQNTIVIRVPSKNYKDFVNESGDIGNITYKQSEVENITQQYYDTTAEVKGLQSQLNRLLIMMNNTTEVSDMIEINREITDVQNQINKLETKIRTMDMDTTYSYVTITITEVATYTEVTELEEDTFFTRLRDTVLDSWESFLSLCEGTLFLIIRILPTAAVLIAIIILIKVIFKKQLDNLKLKKHKAKDFKVKTTENKEDSTENKEG